VHKPADCDYELSFRIWDAAAGGNPVWGPQVFNGQSGPGYGPKIPVVQGYFNVMLGPVDTSGISIANAFNGTDCYIEVTISNRPSILPRQRILSTPYAFRAGFAQDAANAQQLQGRPSGEFVLKSGDTMTGPLNVPIDGIKAGGNQLILSGGNVGVGRTPEDFKLDVYGSARLEGT